MKDKNIKEIVKSKYAELAVLGDSSSCCGPELSFCCNIMNDDYTNVEGYVKDADLGLGCGIPTEYADIKQGMAALDLGSGAGNDVFILRSIVGDTGSVTGLDMTEEMITRAENNNQKLGYSNVSFVLGEIENMPFKDDQFDIIVSNCVLNLVPDKLRAFKEIFRVLKTGGSFCISDIVLESPMPERLKDYAALYTGCVAGALLKDEYLDVIKLAGFDNPKIAKEKGIFIDSDAIKALVKPEDADYVDDVEDFLKNHIKSITITAYK